MIEDGRRDAQVRQRRGGGQAGHAAADDDNVQYLLAVNQTGRNPVLGGNFQPGQVLPQTRFQRIQALRRGGNGQIHSVGESKTGASSP
ncbi:hypothetical protein D3C87_1735360 [compost metagenome]